MNLRPYQLDALESTKVAHESGLNRQLIVMPTGTGKTCVFAALRQYRQFKRRVMVLVHRDELAQQAADKIRQWNPSELVGIEMGSQVCDPNATFVIGSVQTLGRSGSQRLATFTPDSFDALVIDEAHHATASTYLNIINHFQFHVARDRMLLGVTATPNRGDGTGLGKVFDRIVYQMSIPDAIRDGWLVNLRGYRIHSRTTLDGVRTVGGDFDQAQLGAAVNTPERNKMIAEYWLENAKGRKTVGFCADIQHAKDQAAEFRRYGVPAQAIWGDDPQRQEKLADFYSGKIQALFNCNLLTEGWDHWQLRCVITERPTKSPLLFSQMIGRGTRIPDGVANMLAATPEQKALKEDCLVLDVVDNSTRHSIVTLPSLFGMGNLDIQGGTVTSARAKFDTILAEAPGLEIAPGTTLKALESQAEEADLLTVKFDPSVEAHSLLQWHRGPDNAFILLLPNKENVVILNDLLGKHVVVAAIKGETHVETYKTVGKAFTAADNMVQRYAPEYLNLLKRKAQWRDVPPTERQIALLKRLRLPYPTNITKGQAAWIITKFFASKYKKPVA